MATQGIVSLTRNGDVVLKCVAGCDGMSAPKVARYLRDHPDITPHDAFRACLELGFGCSECLVVQSSNDDIRVTDELLDHRYRDHFNDPRFNPRWNHGTADYLEVVETP